MPKIVNKRFRSAARKAADPLSVVTECQQTFSPSEQIHLNGLTENDLFHTIKERLKSSKPSERCVGTDMVSTFVTDKRFANFKSEQIDELFKILGALLLDRAENVRYGSVDALCYLSTLSDDICERIVNNNVIRSLLLMLQTYFTTINFQEPKVTDRKLTLNLYTDAFNILAYCAESSSKCIKELLSNNQLQNIFTHALSTANFQSENADEKNKDNKKYDFTSIAISGAECLTVLVEDSQLFHKLLIEKQNGDDENRLSVLVQKIVDFEITPEMLLNNNSLVYLHILSLFIGSTVKREIPSLPKEIIEKLFNKLSADIRLIMSVEITPQLAELLEKIKTEGSSATFAQLQEMNRLKNIANNIFKSKRYIFVLLTNLLSLEDADADCDDDMNMDDDDDYDNETFDDNGDIQMDSELHGDSFIMNFIQQNSIIEILQAEFNKFLSIPPETVEILKSQVYGQELLQCLDSWAVSVLSLFSNLIQLKQIQNSEQIGNSVTTILFSDSGIYPAEIVEEACNVFREILQNNPNMVTMNIEQLQSLEKSFELSQRFQLNFIKICSIIASSFIAKRDLGSKEEILKNVELITSVLMRLYGQFSGDLVLKAEVLDSLIDIYSDDNEITAQAMRKLDLLQFLRNNEKIFKTEVKCQRQLCKDNAVVGTVALNLRRFINYKQKLG